MSINSRLGRGLESLIPQNITQHDPTCIEQLSIADIRPNPNQPRILFDESDLAKLADSITIHGVVQPIVVRKQGPHYELIAGERRLRASQIAGKAQIPAVIVDVSDKESNQLALVENLLRKDLNSIEVARGYESLINQYQLTHEDLAKIFSKSRSSVTNTLRLLNLPDDVLSMVENQTLSEGHARSLLILGNAEDISRVANQIINENLSVRDTERLLYGQNKKKESPKDYIPLDLKTKNRVKDVEKQLGFKIKVKDKGKKRKIEIQYGSEQELNEILDKLIQL